MKKSNFNHFFPSVKVESYPSQYSAVKEKILNRLNFIWQVEQDFEEEKYMNDYKLINDLILTRTARKDKYTTSLYSLSQTI